MVSVCLCCFFLSVYCWTLIIGPLLVVDKMSSIIKGPVSLDCWFCGCEQELQHVVFLLFLRCLTCEFFGAIFRVAQYVSAPG